VELPAPGSVGCHATFFAVFIESDGVLFFMVKMPIPTKKQHIIGLTLRRIKVCGDKMATGCHCVLAAFLSL